MSICHICDQWVEQLNAFHLTLELEFDALKGNHAELIMQTAERKMAQLDQLGQTETLLLSSLPELSMAQLSHHLLEHCPQKSDQPALLALIQKIKQTNQRNAVLLQSMMRLNEFGLNLLSGRIDTGDTYGSTGQVNSATPISSLTLATA
jgi:flagellar biosynthesis/type III secretory pathway chaperone